MSVGTNYTKFMWKMDESSILEFQIRLSYEVRENVSNTHDHKDVNGIFNAFLNTYRYFILVFLKRILLKILIRKVRLYLGEKKGRGTFTY